MSGLNPAQAAALAYELQKEALALENAAAEKRLEAEQVLREATGAAGASDGVSWGGAAHARGEGAGSRPRPFTASDAGSRSSRAGEDSKASADFADPHGWSLDPIYTDIFIQIRDDILQQQGGYSTYNHLCHTYTAVEFGRPRGERFKTLLKQMNLRFREIFVDCGQGEESCFELVLESLGMRAEPELKRTRRSPRRRSPSRAAPRRRSPPSRAAPRRRSPSRAASPAAPASKGIVPGTRGTVGGAPRAMLNQGASSFDALIAANMPDFPWASLQDDERSAKLKLARLPCGGSQAFLVSENILGPPLHFKWTRMVYHGTTIDAASKILNPKEGFALLDETTDRHGRLVRGTSNEPLVGVFVSPHFEVAHRYCSCVLLLTAPHGQQPVEFGGLRWTNTSGSKQYAFPQESLRVTAITVKWHHWDPRRVI